MVVLGADPDAPAKVDWEEEEAPVRYNPRTFSLLSYFGYHRHMKFSQRFNDFDKKVLSSTFSTLLKRGYGKPDIEAMIDRFWQTWGTEAETPALVFVSKDMQVRLTADLTPQVKNRALEWLVHGMPNEGPVDDPAHIRKSVLLCSSELTHRYPDVVAAIVGLDLGYRHTRRMLERADSLVKWNLGENDPTFDIHEALDALSKIELPLELQSAKRAPASIRKKYERVAQAAAHIPQKRKHVEVPGAA